MPGNDSRRPSRTRSMQEAWPKWMYVAVPALVVFVVVGLWWALFSPPAQDTTAGKTTPTRPVGVEQPTQSPTEQATLAAFAPTATTVLPTLPPATPAAGTPVAADGTPTAEAVAVATEEAAPKVPLTVGDTALACCTDGSGLRMRSGAGTGQPVVKMLSEGSKVEIIGGPQEATGYTWWQIRDDVGTSGWAVDDFLTKQQ
jgi:hypothetical protein